MKIVKINDLEIMQLSDANYYNGDSIEFRLITPKWNDSSLKDYRGYDIMKKKIREIYIWSSVADQFCWEMKRIAILPFYADRKMNVTWLMQCITGITEIPGSLLAS